MLHLKQFPEIFNKINNLGIPFSLFDNFYSTCTSTIMAFVDIIYNEFGVFEKVYTLENIVDIKSSNTKIWEKLGIEYSNHIALFHPMFWNAEECILLNKIFENIEYLESHESLKNRIDSIIQKDCYEMLFIYDGSSSLAAMNNIDNLSHSWLETWKSGFHNLLNTIEYIIASLRRYEKLDDTLIIMYGDHGEDFWTHSFNGGYTHCTEPYSNITNVPLFIYYPGMNSEKISEVFSMRNLNDLICRLVSNNGTLKSYKDVCKMDGFAFSRNMFMKQSEKNKPYRKAYCITDGEYLLMQTNRGYELYMNTFDIGNNFDLLNFYSIKSNDTLLYDLHGKTPISSHFKHAMNECRKREIEKKFRDLKRQLNIEVDKLKEYTK